MKAKRFLKGFLDRLSGQVDLPVPRQDLETTIGIILDLEADISPARLKHALKSVIGHIRAHHHARVYPKRLSELEESMAKAKRFGAKDFADGLLTACSCDYLVTLPSRAEWSSDADLLCAFTCGFSHGLGSAIPNREGGYAPFEETLIRRAVDKFVEADATLQKRMDQTPSPSRAVH